MLPLVVLGGLPNLAAEVLGVWILDGARDVGGDAVAFGVVGAMNVQLDALLVLQGVGRKLELPNAASGAFKRVGSAIPGIEVTDQGDGFGGGSPLANHPQGRADIKVNAELQVRVGVGGEGSTLSLDGRAFIPEAQQAPGNGWLVGFEPGVILNNFGAVRHPRAGWGVSLRWKRQIQ